MSHIYRMDLTDEQRDRLTVGKTAARNFQRACDRWSEERGQAMALPIELIRGLIKNFVKDAAPEQVRSRMQKAVPGIVTKMTRQGMTPDGAVLKVLVRDALFKLWRVVIPSGTVADLIRDSQSDKVVDLVTKDLTAEEKKDLTQIVESTMEAAISTAF